MQCGRPAGALEVSSPTQSDEEYLSPQEEAMELGVSPAQSKRVHFKEPPSFQVGGSHNQKLDLFLKSDLSVRLSSSIIDAGHPKASSISNTDFCTVEICSSSSHHCQKRKRRLMKTLWAMSWCNVTWRTVLNPIQSPDWKTPLKSRLSSFFVVTCVYVWNCFYVGIRVLANNY